MYKVLLGLMLIMISCSKNETAPPPPANTSDTLLNVSYGADAMQQMDIYFPSNRSKETTKLAILIHGGTWSSGDKADLNQYLTGIRAKLPEYAFANVNYRLVTTTGNRFPTQENDVKTAVEFLLSKTNEYNISKKFALIGASAGGHLALLQGYKHSDALQPKALVTIVGPTDLVDLYNHPINIGTTVLLQAVTGYSLNDNPEFYQQSSPVNFVTTLSAPTLLLYGAKDSLVPVSQPNLLKQKLESQNVISELKIYPDGGHGFYGKNLTDSYTRIAAFLEAHVQ